jgi:hypothetical protein
MYLLERVCALLCDVIVVRTFKDSNVQNKSVLELSIESRRRPKNPPALRNDGGDQT